MVSSESKVETIQVVSKRLDKVDHSQQLFTSYGVSPLGFSQRAAAVCYDVFSVGVSLRQDRQLLNRWRQYIQNILLVKPRVSENGGGNKSLLQCVEGAIAVFVPDKLGILLL